MTTNATADARIWRQPRLDKGWEPRQLIGRMQILADRDGVQLPKTYLLIRHLFLWEHGRAPLPGYYATLLDRVFDPHTWRPRDVEATRA